MSELYISMYSVAVGCRILPEPEHFTLMHNQPRFCNQGGLGAGLPSCKPLILMAYIMVSSLMPCSGH